MMGLLTASHGGVGLNYLNDQREYDGVPNQLDYAFHPFAASGRLFRFVCVGSIAFSKGNLGWDCR